MIKQQSANFVAISLLIALLFVANRSLADEVGIVKPWLLPASSAGSDAVCLMPEYASDWAAIQAINYSPDGKRVVTGGGSGNIRVWDTAQLKLVAEKNYNNLTIRHVLFEDSENLLAVACEHFNDDSYPESRSYVVRLGIEGDTLVERSRPGNFLRHVQDIAYSPRTRQMYVDDGRHAIHIYDLSKAMPRWLDTILFPSELMFGTNPTPYTPPRKHVPPNEISVRFPGVERQGFGPPPVSAGSPSVRYEERPLGIELSSDGSMLIVATDKKLRSYRVTTKPVLISEVKIEKPVRLAYHENSDNVYLGYESGSIEVWRMKDGVFDNQPKTFDFQIERLSSMSFSPGGDFLAIGQRSGDLSGIARIENGLPDDTPTLLPFDENSKRFTVAEEKDGAWIFDSHIFFEEKRIAFDPTLQTSLAASNGNLFRIFSLSEDGNLQLEKPKDERLNQPIWSSKNRKLQWVEDSKLAIASGSGMTILDPTTGKIVSETPAYYQPSFSIDGNFVLVMPNPGKDQERTLIRSLADASTEIETDAEVESTSIQFVCSKSAERWVVYQPSRNRLLALFSSGDSASIHQNLSPTSELVGLNSAGQILMTEYAQSDIGGKQYRLIAYPIDTNQSSSSENRYEFSIPEGRKGKFIASPNCNTIAYQIDGDGVYKIVSESNPTFSVGSYGEIGYVSDQGDFLVMHAEVEGGTSRIAVIDPKTNEVMQFWSFPGIIESYAISKDEQFIATANSDGSIGILDLLSPDQWPVPTELSDEPAYGTEELELARLEFEEIIAESNKAIAAFEQRVAAATTDDEKNEIDCEEPHSGIVIRLVEFAEKYKQSDLEYQALHYAMALPRITALFVPGAPWKKKHDAWSTGSSKASNKLGEIARVFFTDLRLNDPRTASVLKPIIIYWRTKQSTELIAGSDDIYRRSSDPKVKASALLICAEANIETQVRFLSSGHHITPPTEQQLKRAKSLLNVIRTDYPELEIDGIGSVVERADELDRRLEQVGAKGDAR